MIDFGSRYLGNGIILVWVSSGMCHNLRDLHDRLECSTQPHSLFPAPAAAAPFLGNTSIGTSEAMFLYNLTVSPTSAINQAIHGNFSGTKQQEIIVARNSRLELLRPDPNTGKTHTILTHEVFGLIRRIAPFRLTGGSKGMYMTRPHRVWQFIDHTIY